MNFVAMTEGKIQASEYKTKNTLVNQDSDWKTILLWGINKLYCSIRFHLAFILLYFIWKEKQIFNSDSFYQRCVSHVREKKNPNPQKQNQITKNS